MSRRPASARLCLVGLVLACSMVAAACTSNAESSPPTTPAPSTGSPNTSSSGSSAQPSDGGGVVTIRMATVGDPGNPSVGVVQTFGGPTGQFVDPPKNTGIYKTCNDAPAAPPPCVTVGAVSYPYGIGEFEVTVSQYVTFLNTVDREGKNPHDLYFDNMSPTVWPKYGSVSYSADAVRARTTPWPTRSGPTSRSTSGTSAAGPASPTP